MSALAARKHLKRSLKSIDEGADPERYHLHQALVHLATAVQRLDEKLTRLEAAAGTTPTTPEPDLDSDEELAGS